MSLEFHNGSWRRMCPGCGTRGCRCKWRQGALYLSCMACDSEFCLKLKARSEGRGVWVRRLADSKFTHYSGGLDDASQSGGRSAGLCGTEEPGRQGLQIGGFLCEGQRSGGAALGDSGGSDAVDRGLQASRRETGPCVDRSAEVRTDRARVLRFVWIGNPEVTAGGGRPVDLTMILVAVLLLAFLTG